MHPPLKECKYSIIIFWEPSYSPHKADFITAVAQALPHAEVIYVAEQDLSDARKAMGWTTPKPDGYQLILNPQEATINGLFLKEKNKTFHVVSGLRRVPSIAKALSKIKKTNSNFAIMSEPRVGEGFKGKLRYLQSWITEGWIRRNSLFILAIGANGPSWFKSVGYEPSKIFPFAYFIKPNDPIKKCSSNEIIKIGYLGRLVKDKGIYDIIRACSNLTTQYTLTFAGSGKEASGLKNLSNQLGVASQFIGVVVMPLAAEFISNLDILILASDTKDDGWGVVVSEALLVGTPVIASNCVGASLVLDNHILGHVVQPNSPEQISFAIEKLNIAKSRHPEYRKIREKWATESLTSKAGASYFIEILNWSSFDTLSRPLDFHRKHTIDYQD